MSDAGFFGVIGNFFTQPAVLGICTGILLGAGLRVFWILIEQRMRSQQILQLLDDALQANKAIVEKNIERIGRDIEGLPIIAALEPLQEFMPSGAELLLTDAFAWRRTPHALWLSLKRVDILSAQIRGLSCEIFEIKRAIKAETRTEVLRAELIPYLKDFNTLTIMRLTELGMECKRASSFLHGKG